MAVAKVPILRHDDPVVDVGEPVDVCVGRSVALGKLGGVDNLVSDAAEEASEPDGELRVDEQLHAAPRLTTRR